jgi:uncharacterized protein YkwD
MCRLVAVLLAAGITAAFGVGPARAAASTPSGRSATNASLAAPRPGTGVVRLNELEQIELAIVAAVNRARVARGRRILAVSPGLARAGDAHVRALAVAGKFSHDWPDGEPFERWILRFYPFLSWQRLWSAGENLFFVAGRLEATDVVREWLASPPHRRNLISPEWRQLGIGVVRAASAPGVYEHQNVAIVAAEFGLRR